jgi:hypothetical protein
VRRRRVEVRFDAEESFVRRSIGFAAALLAAACATPPPGVGTVRDDVLRTWGRPTARYAMPAGAERLEYASGPYGRTTWMIDLDAGGRVTQARQVLNEAEFMQVQIEAAGGMTTDELLRRIGSPGEVRHGGWQGGQVWSWRYPTNDCLWFQVSVTDRGTVKDGAFGIDPTCDAPSPRD